MQLEPYTNMVDLDKSVLLSQCAWLLRRYPYNRSGALSFIGDDGAAEGIPPSGAYVSVRLTARVCVCVCVCVCA